MNGAVTSRLATTSQATRACHKADEYVRGEVHTNTVEGYFSIFKRGMKGVYQHCSEKHLHRYVAEFDFRYSNRVALGVHDGERAARAVKGASHKRLTYRGPTQSDFKRQARRFLRAI
jgi:ISXO2 transposase-like protein